MENPTLHDITPAHKARNGVFVNKKLTALTHPMFSRFNHVRLLPVPPNVISGEKYKTQNEIKGLINQNSLYINLFNRASKYVM